jgi:hypothetical protein
LVIWLICAQNPTPNTRHPKPTTPFDFMTFFHHKRIKVLSKETKYYCFCQSEFISDSFFIEILKNPEASGQHDSIKSALIGINSCNSCNSCLLFTFDFTTNFLNRKVRKVFTQSALGINGYLFNR